MKKVSCIVISIIIVLISTFAALSAPRGDVNSDGKINATDALCILQYSVGYIFLDFDTDIADINVDGKVNSTDALVVLKIAVGAIVPSTITTTTVIEPVHTTSTTLTSIMPTVTRPSIIEPVTPPPPMTTIPYTTVSTDQALQEYLDDLKASADRFSQSIKIKEDSNGNIVVESVDGTDADLFGFVYSAKDKCFITAKNAWQRNFGYNEVYDASAPVISITYDTMRVKFNYGGLEWMIQYWKGQYGMVMIGAEIGVYNRPENSVSGTHYECADDETKLLQTMTVYRRESSTSNNFKPIFTRSMSNTWWCTGFIPGTLGAGRYNVTAEETAGLKVDSKIVLKTPEMAQAFIQGLKEVDLIYHNAPQSTRAVSFKEAATSEEYEKLNNKAMYFLEEDGVTVRVCWR